VSALVPSPFNEAEYKRTLNSIQSDLVGGVVMSDEGENLQQ